MTRRSRVAVLLPLLLAGCGDEAQDLRDWIARERQAAVAPALPPLSLAEAPPPPGYRGREGADPFDPQRLAPPPPPALSAEGSAAAPATPALPPPGAPLDAYPLEALRMVGSLVREGRTLALVRAQGTLHTVQPGDRLGPRGGRVLRITESAITLRERLRDAQGAWTERDTTLALQETAR